MKNVNSKEVSVLVCGPFNEPFDYVLEDKNTNFSVGQIVLVPFGKRKIVGIIIGDGEGLLKKKKAVSQVINEIGYDNDELGFNGINYFNCIAIES